MAAQKQTSRAKRNFLIPEVCEIPGCLYDKIIQKHRILPGRNNGRYILGNVIGLCPNHHAEADRGWWKDDDLLKIVDDRIEKWKIEKDNEFLSRLRDAEAARDYFAAKSAKSINNGNGNGSNGSHAGGSES